MGFIRNFQATTKTILGGMLTCLLLIGLAGCGDRPSMSATPQFNTASEPIVTEALTEVATPSLISKLREDLAQYQPQVKILSPQPNALLNSSTVAVQLQVDDLPLFKDADLGMGPHLHLFIDDQPYQAFYDVSEPVILENLTPGSHLLRVFASRPWHESFKNEGAYAETTFSIFTENNSRLPDFSQPLLTYSRPQGNYGAEPIMLDFYLNNAPLHFVAQENEADNVTDWRIRVTVNGESFIIDNWQPIYLKGFKKGENWLKLEFVDDQGELVENVYNNPVRVINYDPKLNDTLAKLVQNKLPLRTAKKLVSPKALPPEPEVAEPEVDTPDVEAEVIEELEIEIIEVEPLSPEPEIVTPEPAPKESLETESEVTEPENSQDEDGAAIAPADNEQSEAPENATVEEEIEDSLEQIQTETENLINPNVENFEAADKTTENPATDIPASLTEPEPQTEVEEDINETTTETEAINDFDFDRTTDGYVDEIQLEP